MKITHEQGSTMQDLIRSEKNLNSNANAQLRFVQR